VAPVGQHDNETDRRLLLLVGLVVLSAAAAAIISAYLIWSTGTVSVGDLFTAVKLTSLVAVGATVNVQIRIRANTHGISWTEVAFLIGLAVAPAPWVVLCTGLGVGIARGIVRLPPLKLAFGVAKDMLVASAAGLALIVADWEWQTAAPDLRLVVPLAAAYLVAVILDEVIALPVIALASRTSWAHLFRANWGLRLISAAARFPLIVATLLILRTNPWMLLAVPPVVLGLHLVYSARVRARTEQQAWQRLAQATDALNVVELDTVLATAVIQATELFSADEVEVELREDRRLVRGDGATISYTGPAEGASPADGPVISAGLVGHDRGVDVGTLRLRFRGPVTFNERERYTLSTFASALCTAIRNASAYAQLARAAEEHANAAAHDALTGLANRRHLLDRGTELLGRVPNTGVVALLLVDLDHFKEVNDTLGHTAGDRVLVQVADRLKVAAEDGDLVARLGGDEFAVLLSGLPAPAVAAHRAERLLAALREPLDLDGMRLTVEASGGVAVAPGNGGMVELLRRADVAMYQAKRTGQRLADYARCRDTATLSRLNLGAGRRPVVADHEFTVNFQPIVDLGTGDVIAAEALAQWHHPEHGAVDPLRFLEEVDHCELLPTFAEAVLDQSIIAAGSWRDAGFDLAVAVNVLPRSLLDARFPSSLLARLGAYGLPPDRLVLELTEALTISQLEVVDQVLGQLRDAGVRLALDEFGSGYSSLTVLSRIPVHELKIGRTFVSGMETSTEAAAVIRSTVDLGRGLGLVVVAEGVESEPQRRALWELGCTAGQGHLFARPMPATRLLAALHRGSGGRPGTLAPPLHEEGAIIRLTQPRRTNGRDRGDRLPHLPA